MFAIATNGAKPVPVGLELKGVPQDLRDLFTELVDTEVPMTESAAEKIMAYIGKNQETVLARIDGVKDQYYGLDKRVSAHETEVNKVASLDVRIDGLEARLAENALTIDKQLTDIARDVGVLKKIEETAEQEKFRDRRTIKDSAIRYGVVLVLGGLLFAGGVWLKAAVAPVPQSPSQAQQDALGSVTKAVTDLTEEIRTDRAARESEAPPQTIKVPPRGKTRRGPSPPLGPGATYKSGDVIADPNLRASNSIKLESMEWRQ